MHRAYRRSKFIVICALWPHAARWSTHLQDFGWNVYNLHHPIARTSRPVISIFPYTSRNSRPVSVSIFRKTNRRRLVSQWFHSQAADFYDTGYKSWSRIMINVSIPEVNMLKNSSILSVSVPISLFIKLGFVSSTSWSNGYHTHHWIRGTRAQTRPGSMDFLRA